MKSPRFFGLVTVLGACALAPSLVAQVVQIKDGSAEAGSVDLAVATSLPEPVLKELPLGSTALLPGLFHERRELAKAYLFRLRTDNLLQNHLLEAGVRNDKPLEQMHLGWEAPQCQLRGHFAGHWLAAMADFAAIDHDAQAKARADEAVQELSRCQTLNGGRWVGSIPEKYFDILASGKVWIWSPQYTLHKTMMGLFEDYTATGNATALEIVSHSADWYLDWTEKQLKNQRRAAIYDGECAGMLELWANLYGATRDARYLTLASRYAMPDLFEKLLKGEEALTGNHANASIPWIQGAARLFEVTGDVRYRKIVENFWIQGVEKRGMFPTTGSNAGEFWIPSGEQEQHLGVRTQEHCTVYNMIRVAEYLYRWTGEARYADYIERALYNGVLAQQNPNTGMISYFLPFEPGARKSWGTETKDFWCCHGTMVQAQALHEALIYQQSAGGLTVSQFIPSSTSATIAGAAVSVRQEVDFTRDREKPRKDAPFETHITLTVEGNGTPWLLKVRKPSWLDGDVVVTVDGSAVADVGTTRDFVVLQRPWKHSKVELSFGRSLRREFLPNSRKFAWVDGPVVLGGLTSAEQDVGPDADVVPQKEHLYVEGRFWQAGHFLIHTRQGSVALRPLYEIADEAFTVLFRDVK